MFGGIEVGSDRAFITLVRARDANTLLRIIAKRIRPFTTIHSDSWRAYNNISLLPSMFRHLQVNHQLNFVNPQTGCHTQNIESFWQKFKAVAKRKYGINNRRYSDYMAEFLWRREFGKLNEVFYNFWEQVVKKYPCWFTLFTIFCIYVYKHYHKLLFPCVHESLFWEC